MNYKKQISPIGHGVKSILNNYYPDTRFNLTKLKKLYVYEIVNPNGSTLLGDKGIDFNLSNLTLGQITYLFLFMKPIGEIDSYVVADDVTSVQREYISDTMVKDYKGTNYSMVSIYADDDLINPKGKIYLYSFTKYEINDIPALEDVLIASSASDVKNPDGTTLFWNFSLDEYWLSIPETIIPRYEVQNSFWSTEGANEITIVSEFYNFYKKISVNGIDESGNLVHIPYAENPSYRMARFFAHPISVSEGGIVLNSEWANLDYFSSFVLDRVNTSSSFYGRADITTTKSTIGVDPDKGLFVSSDTEQKWNPYYPVFTPWNLILDDSNDGSIAIDQLNEGREPTNILKNNYYCALTLQGKDSKYIGTTIEEDARSFANFPDMEEYLDEDLVKGKYGSVRVVTKLDSITKGGKTLTGRDPKLPGRRKRKDSVFGGQSEAIETGWVDYTLDNDEDSAYFFVVGDFLTRGNSKNHTANFVVELFIEASKLFSYGNLDNLITQDGTASKDAFIEAGKRLNNSHGDFRDFGTIGLRLGSDVSSSISNTKKYKVKEIIIQAVWGDTLELEFLDSGSTVGKKIKVDTANSFNARFTSTRILL